MEKLVRESSAQGHRSMVLVQYLFSCYHRPSSWTVELQLRRNASRRTAREVRRCRRRRHTGLPIARRSAAALLVQKSKGNHGWAAQFVNPA